MTMPKHVSIEQTRFVKHKTKCVVILTSQNGVSLRTKGFFNQHLQVIGFDFNIVVAFVMLQMAVTCVSYSHNQIIHSRRMYVSKTFYQNNYDNKRPFEHFVRIIVHIVYGYCAFYSVYHNSEYGVRTDRHTYTLHIF